MSIQLIQQYYTKVEQIIRYGRSQLQQSLYRTIKEINPRFPHLYDTRPALERASAAGWIRTHTAMQIQTADVQTGAHTLT